MVSDEFELRYGHEVGFGQVASCKIHRPGGGGNLVFFHCGGIGKE
jgi:hypothetical protein